MLLKSVLTLICGLSVAFTATAQIRNDQGHLTPGRILQPLTPGRIQDDRAERLIRMSQRLAEQINQNARSMSDRDLNEVMELLRRAGEIVKSAGDHNMPNLVDAETLSISRLKGGEWITVRYDQPQDIIQLNLRAIGNGSVRVYAVNFVNTAGQSVRVDMPVSDINGNSVKTIITQNRGAATHVQILAEAFRSSMSLTVESYGVSDGQVVPMPPAPPMPPPQMGPKCELYGSGSYNSFQYAYRGGYNNDAKFGTDNFDTMISSINSLESNGLCHKSPDVGCTMTGSGTFNSFSYSHRISAGNKVIIGTDDSKQALIRLRQLTDNRICYPVAQLCDLLSSGSFNGFNYSHRISIGGTVVFGTDNQENAFSFLKEVRQAGLCQ